MVCGLCMMDGMGNLKPKAKWWAHIHMGLLFT